MAQFTTSVIINNSGSVLANQSIDWSWFEGGRVGEISSTPEEGTDTTDGSGNLVITVNNTNPGFLLAAVKVTNATDDLVYYEAGTPV